MGFSVFGDFLLNEAGNELIAIRTITNIATEQHFASNLDSDPNLDFDPELASAPDYDVKPTGKYWINVIYAEVIETGIRAKKMRFGPYENEGKARLEMERLAELIKKS